MPQLVENGIPVGNWDDKYETRNPISRLLLRGFLNDVEHLLRPVGYDISSITEIGCGEGHLSHHIYSLGITRNIKGCDISEKVIRYAKKVWGRHGIDFYVKNAYEIDERDGADLIVCCEVLEHLEQPRFALERLAKITGKYCLISVPREPIWRIMHLLGLQNLRRWGNTPGHVQHYSSSEFLRVIQEHFEVIESTRPRGLWTMALCRPKVAVAGRMRPIRTIGRQKNHPSVASCSRQNRIKVAQ